MEVISDSNCAPSSLRRPGYGALFKVAVRTCSEKSRCGRSNWLTTPCTDRQPRNDHPDRQARPCIGFAIRSFQRRLADRLSSQRFWRRLFVSPWSPLDNLQTRNRRDRQSVVHRSDSETFSRHDGFSGVYRRGRFSLHGSLTFALSARHNRQSSGILLASHRRSAGTVGGPPDLASS